MNQLHLIEILLELIAKNSENRDDRLNTPMALYITACKVNNVEKEIAIEAIVESWDDINLLQQGASEKEIKH